MFLNDNDRKMYELLFVLRNGTPEQVSEYIDNLPPIPEEQLQQHRDKHKNQTRAEKTAELIEIIERIEDHINKTYFTGGEPQCTM